MRLRDIYVTCGVVASALALHGCASQDAIDGPYYPMGFTDGCRTAESEQSSFSTKTYQNSGLFKTDASYRAGWRSGYQQCNLLATSTARPGDLGSEATPR